jgi:preprotein translocase subunit SecG
MFGMIKEGMSAGHFIVRIVLPMVIFYGAILLFIAYLVRYNASKKKKRAGDVKEDNQIKSPVGIKSRKRRWRNKK